jgi:hypothetical protein
MTCPRVHVISDWGKLPFDRLRANGKACPFALSLSKGELAPNRDTSWSLASGAEV